MTKLKVSLHSRGMNKTKPQLLAKGWQNQWITPDELAKWIAEGKAWAGTHFVSGHRCQDNTSGSNCIVFDFDGELQLYAFWATATAKQWCALTYTSFSSTPEVNRFRAVFPLAGIPLSTPAEHKAVYRFIAQKLADELGVAFKDDCGEKAERLWYGNTAASIQTNNGFVPADVVGNIEIPPEPVYEYNNGNTDDLDIQRCIWLLGHVIPPSEDGEYNEVYVPVTAACAAIGETMIGPWQEWVSRGHHGNNPTNMDHRRKWRGLGQRSGPASIFAMAKRLDINWRQLFPHELRFQSAQQIFEAFVCGSMDCVPKRMFRSQ